ncbi:bifunctional 3'-5' exonuclease/DNA polymerase [Natronosporangium hydrolyticum]|uniref:DNA-directed DNA polymerase n=1 Tax=Natronosporangium hydrolyticum TaxID=2811111 RepID=A0A895YTI5_9ACTN|nr:bifunctional 3'-5' exonuclease/DNA polymerase [Natronosporangium hydrolyticum]QSB17358.1 bifunctional 3'-5' exonuclease/DNA polymerase [Natronosporangium hydrolyticum]
MLIAVAGDGAGGGWLRPLDAQGEPAGPAQRVDDLAAAVAVAAARERPRWLWAATETTYPALLRAGLRLARCHDLQLTEALLVGYAGRWGEPRSLAALLARRAGAPVPPDPPQAEPQAPGQIQESLFDLAPVVTDDPTPELAVGYRDQLTRIGQTEAPERFRLLVAAESAGALAAAELGHDGLPWSGAVHEEVLAELLGPRSRVGGLPGRLAELSSAIAAALHSPGLHPESPAELRRAFAHAGFALPDTRAWSLRQIDHPAVPLVREFKERYRIWTAHGWSWRATWVRDGRFRPEYVPGGVVSGRWATRGGGALQIPKAVRRAVVADPGWRLVVADAGQLEPRILAAVSEDAGLTAAAATGDLYAALAAESFDRDRGQAKLALLGAMYGQTGGAALPAIAVLRQRYPRAWDFVEQAAQTGEAGGLVRSWLGRTCPPARREELAAAAARARGRFTRNFVIQATAAEWALVLLVTLRTALADSPAQLVFFQHDEVVVHCPEAEVPAVVAAVQAAAVEAGRWLFGATEVRFPLDVAAVRCYADAD